MRAAHHRLPQHVRHPRVLARIGVAFAAIGIALATSFTGAAASPQPAEIRPVSLLPQNVGVGVHTRDGVKVSFSEAMDTASVDAAFAVLPAIPVRTSWSSDRRTLTITPVRRWATDSRYVVSVPGTVHTAAGHAMGEGRQVAFTTQTAPTISDIQVHYVGESPEVRAHTQLDQEMATAAADKAPLPPNTTVDVSAGTSIAISFSAPMDRADVERRFAIRPHVRGHISWQGGSLVFTPRGRLEPDARYAVSIVGAHDADGNRLGGDVSFSFTTRVGAQITRVSPRGGARNVTDRQVVMWFSQPMQRSVTRRALSITDVETGAHVGGSATWNAAGTQLRYEFRGRLALGHRYRVTLTKAARDVDGNRVHDSWTFATKLKPEPAPTPAPVTTSAPIRTSGPPAPSDMVAYALWQVNQDRAAYGLGPMQLDGSISAVASAYAWDLMNYNYFSHVGRDGSHISDRLRRGGVSFGWSGENLCSYTGISLKATLDWCDRTFMSEPYPGYANHIGNILSTHYTRLGVGVAQRGGKIIIVWDFAG